MKSTTGARATSDRRNAPLPGRSALDLEAIRAEVTRWNPDVQALEQNAGLASRLRPQLRLYLLGCYPRGSVIYGRPSLRRRHRACRWPRRVPVGNPRAGADGSRRRRSAERPRGAGTAALEEVRGEVPVELVSVPLYANVREFLRNMRVSAGADVSVDSIPLLSAGSRRLPGRTKRIVYLRRCIYSVPRSTNDWGSEKGGGAYRRFYHALAGLRSSIAAARRGGKSAAGRLEQQSR